jgi:hypothetical protein
MAAATTPNTSLLLLHVLLEVQLASLMTVWSEV